MGEALAARRPGQREVATTTADGTLCIRLLALTDAAPIEIHTPAGIFRGPDHVVEIADLEPGLTRAGVNRAEANGVEADGTESSGAGAAPVDPFPPRAERPTSTPAVLT